MKMKIEKEQRSVVPTQLLVDAASAIAILKSAFGAPGDYGYGTKEGDALFEIYKLLPRFHDAIKSNEVI